MKNPVPGSPEELEAGINLAFLDLLIESHKVWVVISYDKMNFCHETYEIL